MVADLRPLVVTLGEPAGVGPDLTLMVWHARASLGIPPFYVVGDPGLLARRAAQLGFAVPIETTDPAAAASVFPRALPVSDVGIKATAAAGSPDDTSAPVAIAAIRRAAADVLAGAAAAIVTNPIAKSVLYRAGFTASGHTEFLARLAAEATGVPVRPVMMLWSPELAVVPVTIHVPLAKVCGLLNVGLIVDTGQTVARDLAARFGIPRPRLAVAGLNPHAGEGGTIGHEEQDIIAPAVARLRAEGIDARGPLSADTLFHAAARSTYDAALCMYHDQALIPVKALAFEQAVNVTLGLPFVRTSPDHGTAFDIAGTGRANPSSLIAAIRLAIRLAGRADAGIAAAAHR